LPIPETFAELQAHGGVMMCLSRHRARAEYSLAKLRDVGFTNIEPYEGVDSFTEDVRRITAAEGWSFHPKISASRIGNALSILRLWRQVVNEGLPYILIFEDDVLPRPDVARLGPRYWEDTPRDLDFVYLGNQMTIEPRDEGRLVVQAVSWCTHAHIVSNEGAHRALQLLSRTRHDFLDEDIDGADTQIRQWMGRGVIRWACWNGTHLPKVFKTSDEVANLAAVPSDVAWSRRDTGLFYQNYALGSTIQDPESVWSGPREDAQDQTGPLCWF
jgi:hypothetical protein